MQWRHAGDVATTTVAVLPTKNLLWRLWSLNNNLDTFDSPSGYNSVAPTRRTTFVSSVGLMTNRLATNNQGQCYPYPGQLRKKHCLKFAIHIFIIAAVIGMNWNTVYLLHIVSMYMVL